MRGGIRMAEESVSAIDPRSIRGGSRSLAEASTSAHSHSLSFTAFDDQAVVAAEWDGTVAMASRATETDGRGESEITVGSRSCPPAPGRHPGVSLRLTGPSSAVEAPARIESGRPESYGAPGPTVSCTEATRGGAIRSTSRRVAVGAAAAGAAAPSHRILATGTDVRSSAASPGQKPTSISDHPTQAPAMHPPASLDPEVRLALAARAGDGGAFESLVSRHDARLRSLCATIAGNPHDADDAVQEAWLRVLSGIRRFTPGDISAWLSVIARNEVHRLASARRPITGLAFHVGGDSLADDPYERLRVRELMATVTGALRGLPPGQREVVVREAVGQSPAETAAALGLTPGALRSRRHRARKALRAALAETAVADTPMSPWSRETFAARPGFSHRKATQFRQRSTTMAIGQNDVNLTSVETNDLDFRAGQNFDVTIEAEAGATLHGGGGKYRVRMTVTDTTNPALLNQQDVDGNYGDAKWPAPGLNTFTFTVPAAATTGRDGDILEPQARLISNAAPPFDTSHVVGASLLLTP
jgi:RNA polymerase sigma-70 factor (ECF subfamily)